MTTATKPQRVRRAGVAIIVVALYVVTAWITATTTGRPLLPLFEGIGPAPDYSWVAPPPAFAAANVAPKPFSADVAIDEHGSAAFGAASPDGQIIVTFAAGAVAPRPRERTARLTITPLDPTTLPALPDDIRFNGNAYLMTIRYGTSGTAVTRLESAASVVLGVPLPPDRGVWEHDDDNWKRLEAATSSAVTTISTQVPSLGIIVSGTTHRITVTPPESQTVRIMIAAAVGLLLAAVGLVVVIRLRRSGTI